MSYPDASHLQSLQQENQRLKKAVEELSVINDLARAISVSPDPQEIMQTIIRRSLRAIHDAIRKHRDRSAKELIAAAKSHAGSAPQMDDMTLVVIKRRDG